eukprot:TRINITY_DN4090_c0_g1_i3.p1 TRINITY_DN4090_c0_g1~~TRINITY_DN4090_c0_g1_i3.p1  ORF type:complete len:255 (+),score=29.97 TRINITY_DN4090_c0_g1_i3:497-1261(+)
MEPDKAGFYHLSASMTPKNIIQGNIDDLTFLNSLILVASNQEVFGSIIALRENESFRKKNFLFTLRFFKDKITSVYVTIDNRLPCVELENGELVPFFCRSKNGNEFWPSFFEKAYAKYKGFYGKLTSLTMTRVLLDLIGIPPTMIEIDRESTDESKLWESLSMWIQNGTLVGALCFLPKRGVQGVPVEHLYVIQKVVEKENKRMVEINDPWGLAKVPNVSSLEIPRGNQGIFLISFDDFFQIFDTLVVLSLIHI